MTVDTEKPKPYSAVPGVPDRLAIERAVLRVWDETGVFEERRARNAGAEAFSFLDGPITANNPMGVHHAWGRTLKDIVHRYQSMQGRELRWQSGFDCQGLWVEVEVERALGFDAKRDIEAFGIDRFAAACRDRVTTFAARITEQSRRLGMWMDWERSYFTMADTNISAIWTFLKECHRRGWLYEGHRLMPWCHRCGTSLSQHELADSYADVEHPSVFLTVPLRGVDEEIAVWTTTPWTLPANVALAVHPDAVYVLADVGGRRVWMAERRVAHVAGAGGVAGAVLRTAVGRDLVGRRYGAPFAALEVAVSVDHQIVAWDDVSVDEGTGVVHIAPGCGTEDFALAAAEQLPVLAPLEEDGRYTAGYGWLSGRHVDEVESGIVDALDASGMLFGHDRVTHRYPMCWRCNTPLVHRVVDEWFLACDEVREPMRRAARTVRWQPAAAGRRMDDWLKNMGDWCISRKRYWGLPLPFYKCPSGHLTVVGSKDELVERALDPTGAADLPELHRPWIDGVRIRCEACGAEAQRVTEVGDCWLDAGIVAFSTLGWTADDQAEWERWFPAEVVCEMSEQIRLWFYALLFMSVVLDGRAPYRQALVHSHVTDERGEEMHKSKGNAIWFDEAVERTGADSMRWLFASQPPDRDLRFGNAALEEVNRKFLTFWNTYAFFVTYANVDGFRPRPELRSEGPVPDGLDDLDRWALARLAELVDRSRRAYDDLEAVAVTAAFDRFADDLSNWYVRRSRARFWRGVHAGDSDKQAAYETLWFCLVTALRVVAPVMPFVADHMWTNLVAGTPRSVHLDEYPDLGERWRDDELLTAMAEVRAVAELGRVVRTNAGIRRRQPLRVLYAVCADASARRAVAGHSRLVADECNVAEVSVVDQADDFATTELVPDYARLGPRFRDDVPAIARLIAAGDVVRVDGGYRVGRWDLDEPDVVVRRRARPGYAVAEGRGWVVAVDVTVTPDLELEGRARDLVRALQVRRKDLDLDVTTPVQVTYPPDVADVVAVHGAWIAEQTLAASLEPGDALNLRQ